MVTLDAIEIGATTGSTPVTADFLLKILKENSEHLIKSFNARWTALSTRIDGNAAQIVANTSAIADNAASMESQANEIRSLTYRVARLERAGPDVEAPTEPRATLGAGYLVARRSIRLWPIQGDTEDSVWEGISDFLHEILAMREDEIGQEDIESIVRPVRGRVLMDRREVIVKFYDKQKRDQVVSSSPCLASRVDKEGKPTPGIRLEVPPELHDTFRLRHRFGTRLRARHGVGTKRHIKFDDFNGSLFTNIKLPGDSSWTRVTSAMAREDLGASLRKENTHTQKRLGAKLVPGPRERLQRPMADTRVAGSLRLLGARGPPQTGVDPTGSVPSGKRPRWSVPDRGKPL